MKFSKSWEGRKLLPMDSQTHVRKKEGTPAGWPGFFMRSGFMPQGHKAWGYGAQIKAAGALASNLVPYLYQEQSIGTMKTLFLGIFLSTLGLMSCSSQKALEGDPPFIVNAPTVEYWQGGREESGHGMRFTARWAPQDPSAIRIDSLYFRGRVYPLEVRDSETGFMLFAEDLRQKHDLVMHADSTREVGNQPPMPLPAGGDFPFDLRPDEAVISYTLEADGKQYYTRVSGVREKRGRIYPGRPQG